MMTPRPPFTLSRLSALIAAVVSAPVSASEPPAPAPSSSALPADRAWVYLHSEREGDFFFDHAHLVRNGDVVRYTMGVVLNAPGPQGMVTALAEVEIDCARQTTLVLGGDGFAPDGSRVLSRPANREEELAMPIIDGSRDADLYRRFCPEGRPLPPPGTPIHFEVRSTGDD